MFDRDSFEGQEDCVTKRNVGTGDLFVIRFFCPSSAPSKVSVTFSGGGERTGLLRTGMRLSGHHLLVVVAHLHADVATTSLS